MSKDAMPLPNTIDGLQELVLTPRSQLADTVAQWQLKYDHLLEQFRLAKQRQFTASSEKNVLQMDLFDEVGVDLPTQADTSVSDTAITVPEHQRQQPKRKPIPEHFPRQEIIHDITEAEKQCACGGEKVRFGEEVTEQLDVIPAKISVIRHVRPKYACRACQEGVSIAKLPKVLLPKSMAAAGLIAHTVVAKYVDHVPLYRQEHIWSRYGVTIPRNSSCGWVLAAAERCEPLYALLKQAIVAYDYCQVDETRLQVMKEANRTNQQQSYMWVYRGGPVDNISVVFDYQETRAGKQARTFLSGFRGYLQTDGYSGYDWANTDKQITHLGCMAHARRPFAELVKLTKQTGKAHQALSYIQQLYRIESHLREQNITLPQHVYQYRQQHSKPILEKLYVWLQTSLQGAPPKGKLGQSIKYMVDRWQALCGYCDDGRLHIDNNLIENAIRPFTVGRKNWLFAGGPRGAKAGAILYSLIATAKANQIDAYQYLRFIFEKIPQYHRNDDMSDLLPWNVKSIICS